jgi:MoxR-like ATPase
MSQIQTQINLKPITQIKSQLSNIFVGRENEIIAVLAGLVSGEPVILVGEPGTAKTALIESLSKLISAKYFYYLLTRFTEPDELLGPLDINALREGKYTRITKNRLPEAEIVFLDEIFKASSAVRNILLDIILNKRILNGGEYHKLPMLALYTASNEVSTDEEDKAFYDRLVIRVFVKYVDSSLWDELLVKGIQLPLAMQGLKPVADANYIRALQQAVVLRAQWLAQQEEYRKKYIEALGILRNKGIELSDRRKIKVLYIASAISMVYGEDIPSYDSLADALRFTTIHNEDDIRKVEEAIMEVGLMQSLEHAKIVMTVVAEVRNMMESIMRLGDNAKVSDIQTLKKLIKKAAEVLTQIPESPRLARQKADAQSILTQATELVKQYERKVSMRHND